MSKILLCCVLLLTTCHVNNHEWQKRYMLILQCSDFTGNIYYKTYNTVLEAEAGRKDSMRFYRVTKWFIIDRRTGLLTSAIRTLP